MHALGNKIFLRGSKETERHCSHAGYIGPCRGTAHVCLYSPEQLNYLFEIMLSLFLVNNNKLNLSDSLQNRRNFLRILGKQKGKARRARSLAFASLSPRFRLAFASVRLNTWKSKSIRSTRSIRQLHFFYLVKPESHRYVKFPCVVG